MMADADPGSKPVDSEALVADIDRTRAELARTIDAISDRVSPKRNAERVRERVRERVARVDPVLAGAAAAAVAAGVVAVILWRNRPSRRARRRS